MKCFFFIALLLLTAQVRAGAPAGPLSSPSPSAFKVWEGFELGTTQWVSSDEGGLLDAQITRDVASEGGRSFGGRVEIKDASGGQKAGFFLQPDADFSQVEEFRFDIYVAGQVSWKGKLVLQSGAAWYWHEADLGELKQGWNRNLGINLKTYQFQQDGKPSLMRDPQLLAKIQILLTPTAPTQGGLYLDNVRLTGPGAEALAPKRLPSTVEALADSFEGRVSAWKPVSGAAVKVEADSEFYSQGAKGLKLITYSKTPEQNAIFGIEKDFDLTNVQSLILDVYNPGGHSLLSLGIAYGPNWSYAESPANRLKPGWNHNVTFDLQSKNFKSEASGWKNTQPLPDPKSVRRVGLVYAPGSFGEAGIIIDNLRVRTNSQAALALFKPAAEAGGLSTPWEKPAGLVTAHSDFSEATGAGVDSAHVSNGSESLKLDWDQRSASSAATYELLKPIDLLGVRAIEFDAYVPGDAPVDLGMAFETGEAGEWHESRAARLSPGWNEGVLIPMEGVAFKSAATQWAYATELPEREAAHIKKAYFQVAPTALGEGSVSIANLSLVRRPDLASFGIPITFQGNYKLELAMDSASYEPWDGGFKEGDFENGLSNWAGINGGGFDLSTVQLSTAYPSLGKQSLRIDMRGSGNNKAGVVFTSGPGHALPDLSVQTRIRLDIFNPGPPLAFSMAFTEGAFNQWWESLPVPLHSGWNRDVTVDLEAPIWKPADISGSSNAAGASTTWTVFPANLRTGALLKTMHLNFLKASAGTVYVDNIRLGKAGGTFETGGEASLGMHFFAGRFFEIELGGKAGKSQDGSAWVLPAGSTARIRAGGQELALSLGKALSPFDDALKIFTGSTGNSAGYGQYIREANDNRSSLTHRGGILGLEISDFLSIPWYRDPYTGGEEMLGGLRVKAPLGGLGYFGGAYLDHRFGYDTGVNVLSGKAEQDVQVGELDAELQLPWGVKLRGAYGQTTYAVDPSLYLLHDALGDPALLSIVPGASSAVNGVDDPTLTAFMVGGEATAGIFTLSGTYKDVGGAFYTLFTDDLYNAKKLETKLLAKLDGLQAVKDAGQGEGYGAALLHGMSLGIEYGTHKGDDHTYESTDYKLRFENAKAEKLGYTLVVESKEEPLSDISKKQGELLMLRGTPWKQGRINAGLSMSDDTYKGGAKDNVMTYGVQLSQRFLGKATAGLDYGMVSRSLLGMSFSALSANLAYAFDPALGGELSYGRKPFYDDELSLNWLTMDPRIALTIRGSF